MTDQLQTDICHFTTLPEWTNVRENAGLITSKIDIKHTRKVARDNTVKYYWRVLPLLPDRERPSYAGLRVDVLVLQRRIAKYGA